MKKYGYERGKGEELDPQSELLYSIFCVDRVFTDPHLKGLEDFTYLYKLIENNMEQGSALCVESIYSVSNNIDEFFKLTDVLDKRNIHIVAANESIENVTAFGRSMLKVLKGAYFVTQALENDELLQRVAIDKLKEGVNGIKKLYIKKNMLSAKK